MFGLNVHSLAGSYSVHVTTFFNRIFTARIPAWLLLALAVGGLCSVPANAQENVLNAGSPWRWRKGTNEVSNPSSLWRGAGFNDAAWSVGNAPFYFGETLSGTLLSDMRNNYTCVYLRTRFALTNVTEISQVQFQASYDDGFVAWINGVEVARSAVTPTSPAYTNTATVAREFTDAGNIPVALPPQNYLVAGTNVLAVQAFNVNLSSSTDFVFDTALQVTKTNLTPITITSVVPAPGATLGALTQVSVTFNKVVYGVEAADFLVNDQPASVVTGAPGTNRYVFGFTQPLPGPVAIGWDDFAGITDLQGVAFNFAATNATWTYNLVDNVPPVMRERTPVPGATVSQLTQVEILFSEPVTGVDAADLRVYTGTATNVSGSEAGPYVFSFPQPVVNAGVGFSWAGGHGITDYVGNAFAGGGWTVLLDPRVGQGNVVINEIVAGNVNGLTDEDGENSDWIELYNRGNSAVNLLGWSLTDDPAMPGRWTFPAKTINPGEYLVVFASGKDRRSVSGTNKFHTNFKLDLFGDYLALYNADSPRLRVSEFAPRYPEQRNDYAYGRDGVASNVWRYFVSPTPETANGSSVISNVAPVPHFSVARGLFDQPFNLLLTAPLSGATIRYTRDGSEPTLVNGLTYFAPIAVSNTLAIRAAVFVEGYLPSRVETHSYLFLDSVLAQPNNPAGYPATWGSSGGFPNNIVPADYAMDLDPLRVDPNDPASAIDPEKLQRFKDGMREWPIVSLVLKRDDMFGPAGLYPNSSSGNKNSNEKACSVEMLLPDGSTAFVVGAGIDLHGNASRDPNKNPKHGFKLNFRGDFGESKLDYPLFPDSPAEEFDDLILRPDFGSSWRHWSDVSTEGLGAFQRSRATRTRDAFWKDTFRDMGRLASHSRYFHLFINGLYWGTFDFTEQPTKHFAVNYFGGEEEYFDIYDQGALASGTATAYNTMLGITNLADNANYELMKQALDMPEYIDYMLHHFFTGAQDWGFAKNWYAVRKRVTGAAGTFKYIPWDGENILLDENINRVPGGGGSTDIPSGLQTKLDDNPQFRLDFADRVHKHMIAPNGALTPAANIARWQKWQALLDKPIVAESLRWGDYRRDVHQYQNGPYVLYTREDQWLQENERMVNSYLPNRNATVLAQLRAAGLYPSLEAPEFRDTTLAGPIIGGGAVLGGFVVALRNPGVGTIYYTTNGVDPRVPYTGVVAGSAQAYSGPLTLNVTRTLKARVFNGGNWSALNEATFTIGEVGVPLRTTEIMYNPVGGDAYEFIELQNVGEASINLGSYSFSGITFLFPENTMLAPGAVLLLANNANPAAFATRYPSAVVSGYYSGNLSNGGERIAITDASGQTVIAVHYDDEAGWPTSPDGGGFSLEIVDPRGDPNAPANWRASSAVNGTPGLPPVPPAPSDIVLNEVMADNAGSVTNGGAFPDWLELYNRGASAVDLTGWSLTDNGNARLFVFPSGTTLAAGDYLVVWCDSLTGAPGLHAGFALGKNGETISLYNAATNRVDALTFGLQLTDLSVGRVGETWQLNNPTPGSANVAATLAAPTNLTINEWLAAPEVGGSDWLELFNRSSNAPVALRGLYLGTSNAVFHYSALSFLAPRSHVPLFAEEMPGADQVEFKLPAEGGAIFLADETGEEFERVTYSAQALGVSAGRLPDGGENIVAFPGSVSPGAANHALAWTGPALNEILARNDGAVISPWGSAADFVEIHNPGGSAFSLAGMGLGDSSAFGNAWRFSAGASIPAGGYVVVWCDSGRAASSSASPYNTGFALGGESGDVVLFNDAGEAVDIASHGLQVKNLPLGRSGGSWQLLAGATPGAANAAPAPLGAVTALRINEWLAAPVAGSDWIELYNPNPQPVALGGLFLTDDPSTTGITNSPLAPLSFLGAGQWAWFVADGLPNLGRDHLNFSLAQEGETIRLYTTNRTLIDAVDFGVQAKGVSMGRLPDGGSNLVSFVASVSPGAANYLPLTNVVINEILTHTDPPLEDAVELFNPSANEVNIGGWYLSDNASDLKRYLIPNGTVIPAGGFKVFYQNQFGSTNEDDAPPLFSFNSARGDEVHLSQADGSGNLTGYRALASFAAAANGVSFGRYQTSVGVEFVALSRRTFGVDNPTTLPQFRTGMGASNAYPAVGPIVISEIMYHPRDFGTNNVDDEEFVELLNITGTNVALYDVAAPTNSWRLASGVSFNFATNLVLAAGERLLVVAFNPTNASALAAFRARHGTNATRLVGPFSGKLDNAGESVELWRPDMPQGPQHTDAGFVPQLLVDRVAYTDQSPWPAGADGLGDSLQRVVAANYGNDPVNWQAAPPRAGDTGAASAPVIGTPPQSQSVFVGETVTFNVAVTGDALLTYLWQFNNAPLAGQTASNLTFASVQLTNAGSYRVAVTNAVGGVVSSPATLTVSAPPSGNASVLANGSVRLTFPVLSNRSYQVQYKANLTDATWLPLGSPVFVSGNTFTLDDALAGQAQRFYRLAVLP